MRWLRKTEWKDGDGAVTSVEEKQGRYGPLYTVSFNYKVGEHWYGGVFTGNEDYKKDDWLPVSYDPADPDRNQYTVSEGRTRLVLIVGAILLLAWGLAVVISSLSRS